MGTCPVALANCLVVQILLSGIFVRDFFFLSYMYSSALPPHTQMTTMLYLVGANFVLIWVHCFMQNHDFCGGKVEGT